MLQQMAKWPQLWGKVGETWQGWKASQAGKRTATKQQQHHAIILVQFCISLLNTYQHTRAPSNWNYTKHTLDSRLLTKSEPQNRIPIRLLHKCKKWHFTWFLTAATAAKQLLTFYPLSADHFKSLKYNCIKWTSLITSHTKKGRTVSLAFNLFK